MTSTVFDVGIFYTYSTLYEDIPCTVTYVETEVHSNSV